MNFRRPAKAVIRRVRCLIRLLLPESISTIKKTIDDLHIRNSVDKGTQILLSLKYRELAFAQSSLPFDEVEFRNYSQNGEDGILLYIFSLIGTTNKRCVEVCAGNGIECNCSNLIINHG